MAKWYDGLKPRMRQTVKLLRDNGINTFYSCDESMIVEVECYELEDIETIHKLLTDHGYEHFKLILVYYEKRNETLAKYISIRLPMDDGFFFNDDIKIKDEKENKA